jgi:hypothetical protein
MVINSGPDNNLKIQAAWRNEIFAHAKISLKKRLQLDNGFYI